jgi:hypothetical protein
VFAQWTEGNGVTTLVIRYLDGAWVGIEALDDGDTRQVDKGLEGEIGVDGVE